MGHHACLTGTPGQDVPEKGRKGVGEGAREWKTRAGRGMMLPESEREKRGRDQAGEGGDGVMHRECGCGWDWCGGLQVP